MVVMATAFDLTGQEKYRAAVREGMDYLLGRNALNRSYVTGYGEVASKNQHSRWYSHQLDPALPNPPRGSLSGGPNSGIQDPLAQRLLQGCKPQFCYIDDIESWATNELTINWNSPLSWVSAFLTDKSGRSDCRVRYSAHGSWPGGFTSQVVIENTGKETVDDWSLRWSFLGGQRVRDGWGATLTQSGSTVTAKSLGWNGKIRPGRSVTFGFVGSSASGPNPAPEVFHLNGDRCT
jgi:endoglucanase